MKIAKSYKIIILVTAFILSIAAAFGSMNAKPTYAATVSADKYFSVSDTTEANFTSEGLVLSGVEKTDTLSFNEKFKGLILNNLSFELELPANLNTIITLVSESFYVNGNPVYGEDGKIASFDTKVTNQVKLISGDTVKCSINGGEEFEVDLTDDLDFGVEGNYLTVDGQGVPTDAKDLAQYKIKNIDNRAVAKSIKVSFEEKEGATVSADEKFVLKAIDQYKGYEGENNYRQSLTAEGVQTKANPRIALSDSFYTKVDANGTYKALKVAMADYETVSFTDYKVLVDDTSSSGLYLIDVDGKIALATTDQPKKVKFTNSGDDVKFGVGKDVGKDDVVYETFTVDVKPFDFEEEENADNAPKYINDPIALASFKSKLNERLVKEDGGVKTSVPLGTTLELPSFEDLVYDNFTSYTNLKKTVYYKTVDKDTTTTDLKIKLDSNSDYLFFVVFSDGVNSMDVEDFYVENEDGTIDYEQVNKDFIFRMTLQDDAPITVESAKQGWGYKGIKYVASKFTVDASGCKTTYKLYFNEKDDAKKEDEGWVEIPKLSSINEDTYESEVFTYDEIKEINYDGNLTFIPTRTGSYMIECVAMSEVSGRSDEAATIIQVKEPSVVKVPSEWLKNNTWSVVFLSVGTLCLIGIIVLLCIKPKEETDND